MNAAPWSWHPWPAEPGAFCAVSRFGVAVYIARPNPSDGFTLYRGGLHMGQHDTVDSCKRQAEESEVTYSASIRIQGRKNDVQR